MPQRYFVDTSALLVRFLTRADGHSWMRQICESSPRNVVVIAEITEAELAASLHQLTRGGILRKKRCEAALAIFWSQVSAHEYQIIPATTNIIRRAADLCAVHALRGYDAVQMACALAARDDARQADATTTAAGGASLGDPIIVTEDLKLRTAVLAEGFVADSPMAHP